MIRLIAFDWDDVFTTGAKDAYAKCYHEAVTAVGVHLEVEEELRRILSRWSRPHTEELAELLKEHPELVDEATRVYEEKFFSGFFVDQLNLVEGSVDLLNRLSAKYILALITGAHPKVLKEQIFPKFKIPQVFSKMMFTYELSDFTKAKPNPFMLEEVLKSENVAPQEAVFVGDAKSDILMAQAAGVAPVAVLTGHLDRKQAEELGVKYIIDDVAQLESVLDVVSKI